MEEKKTITKKTTADNKGIAGSIIDGDDSDDIKNNPGKYPPISQRPLFAPRPPMMPYSYAGTYSAENMGPKLTAINNKVIEMIKLIQNNNNYIGLTLIDCICLRYDGQLILNGAQGMSKANNDNIIKFPYIYDGKVLYLKAGKSKSSKRVSLFPVTPVKDCICNWKVIPQVIGPAQPIEVNIIPCLYMPADNIEKMIADKPYPIGMMDI